MQIACYSAHGPRLQMHARLMYTMYYTGERAYNEPATTPQGSCQRAAPLRSAPSRNGPVFTESTLTITVATEASVMHVLH